MEYVRRRVLASVPTVLILSLMIFGLLRILPGDVARLILVGPEGLGTPTPEDIATVRAKLGLDRPLPIQYLDWLRGMVMLDVGDSLWSGRPVFDELFRRLPVTVELGLLAMATSLLIGIPLGVTAAIKRGTWMDYTARTFALGGLSIPGFWISMLLVLAMVTWFDYTPPLGYVEFFQSPWENVQQLIMPALALGYIQAALVSRLIRSSLLEVLREDYTRTARSKGLTERTVIMKHALRNALLPLITVIGVGLADIIGGTVIIETVFNLPGVGRYLVDAIQHRDYPVVQTLTFIFAMVFAVTNLLVDLLYGVLDPRIRLG